MGFLLTLQLMTYFHKTELFTFFRFMQKYIISGPLNNTIQSQTLTAFFDNFLAFKDVKNYALPLPTLPYTLPSRKAHN